MTQERRWAHFALRVLSGIAAVFVLLTSALFTFGTSLAAPFGIFVARQLARRKGRPLTGLVSWLSSAAASSIAILLLLATVVAMMPPTTFQEIRDAVAAAQAEDTTALPDWMTRAFPPAARPDPVTREVVHSPVFTAYFGALGLVIGCAFLGTIAGSAGWLGTFLLGYALRGRHMT
jgi:hypothetical protein